MRGDLDELVAYARGLRIPVALAPSVTPLLDDGRIESLRALGVKIASISLDGATATTHDAIRGVDGHFEQTTSAVRRLRARGVTVQVNTVVMADTVHELPAIARLVQDLGAGIWELFFLVHVGRGETVAALDADDNEAVCHFLFDAAHHGFIVRTVEAPFFRRVCAQRSAGEAPPDSGLYRSLRRDLRRLVGRPSHPVRAHTKGTRDGDGIVFVGHDGTITPSGFLPIPLGNVRDDDIVTVYREHELLRSIRRSDFGGRCGACEFKDACGGSRARAFAATGDPLAEDPGCTYAGG